MVSVIETKNPQKIVDVRSVKYSDENATAAVYLELEGLAGRGDISCGVMQCSLASVNCSIIHL